LSIKRGRDHGGEGGDDGDRTRHFHFKAFAFSSRTFLARFLGAGIRAQEEEVAPRTSRSRMSLDLRWSLLATRIDGVARAREQNERQIPKQ
jgi:hypothetical protein